MAYQKAEAIDLPQTPTFTKGFPVTLNCKSFGCYRRPALDSDFCDSCALKLLAGKANKVEKTQTLAERYPQYYKPVGEMTEIDVYAVHHLFDVQDPSGAIQHSSKKLLLSGVRTGGKSKFKDIKEARDTLTRWLQLNPEDSQ